MNNNKWLDTFSMDPNFSYIKDKRLQSIKDIEIKEFLSKFSGVNVILVDLNDCKDASFCNDVIYLIEPTTIKLNKLISRKKDVFTKLGKKKVILNKSALLSNDVSDFEKEAGINIFYNMPSLDERKRNSIINDFLNKLGVISSQSDSNSNKIFGLFRK